MSWRVAIGGFWHETNTFATGATTLADFQAYQYSEGAAVLERSAGTGTELGGMIAAARRLGCKLYPTLSAAAVPSAMISADAMDAIRDRLTRHLARAGALDGILFSLHGAAVSERSADADGEILRTLRSVAGDIPIVATFDYHANLGPEMLAGADVLIGYDTFPHTDMAERGEEAAGVLARLLRDGKGFARRHVRVPLLTVPQSQATACPPLADIFGELHELEREPGILCGSIAMGYPYADVAHLGASVLLHGTSADRIEAAAGRLAARIWAAREAFAPSLAPVDEAVRDAMSATAFPTLLVESADNVGGGSAGDGTATLEALLRLGATGAVIVLHDPEAAAQAAAAGAGAGFSGRVGGKTDRMHGAPAAIDGTVAKAGPASFVHQGTYKRGITTDMGLTAVLDCRGNTIVLTSRRVMPFDKGHLTCLGIDPALQRIIVVKSALAWRAAFGDIARKSIVVDTPGVCSENLERFSYRHCPRPIYPLDPAAEF